MNLISMTYGDSIQPSFSILTAVIYIAIIGVLLAGLWRVYGVFL